MSKEVAVEEFFVCTLRPDSCRAVQRTTGQGSEMIHLNSREEARQLAKDLAIKYCSESYRQQDNVLGFVAKYTRCGGGLPYINEDLGTFGKNGEEIFRTQAVVEETKEPEPEQGQMSFLGM